MSGRPSPSLVEKLSATATLCFNNLCYLLVPMGDERYYCVKARALCALGDYPRAIHCIQKALRAGESSSCREHLAWCYRLMGDFHSALENYQLAYAINKRANLALGLATMLLELGRFDEAHALLADIRRREHSLNRKDRKMLAAVEEFATKLESSAIDPEDIRTLSQVACPHCKRSPHPLELWPCSCGEHWNTFRTGARCPKCGTQWSETGCLGCGKMSPHEDWYTSGRRTVA